MVACVPYRSSLRYNSMVHDVSHGVQIEAFIYSRLKGREICQRALLATPATKTIISLRAVRSALFGNFARRSEHLRAYLKRSTTVKRVLCAFALYGLVSYSGSLPSLAQGAAKFVDNYILEVVATILAA